MNNCKYCYRPTKYTYCGKSCKNSFKSQERLMNKGRPRTTTHTIEDNSPTFAELLEKAMNDPKLF